MGGVAPRIFSSTLCRRKAPAPAFVLDKKKAILTNYHVIEGAESIEVAFADRFRRALVTIIGVDLCNDVAGAQGGAAARPVVARHPGRFGRSACRPMGDCDRQPLRPISCGTLTTGVISVLDRTLEGPDDRTITGIIQTDAAINCGNSGGPLLDSSGNCDWHHLRHLQPDRHQCWALALPCPSDTLKRILPDSADVGALSPPVAGHPLCVQYHAGAGRGVEAAGARGAAACADGTIWRLRLANAGVRGAQHEDIIGNERVYTGGDLLTVVDGEPVSSVAALETLENTYRVGDVVTVAVIREGCTLEMRAEAGGRTPAVKGRLEIHER